MGRRVFAAALVVAAHGQEFHFEHNQTTPGGHGQFLVGHFGAGMPLYMSHIPANMNPHTFDATWQVKLFDASDADITDAVQKTRQHGDPGQQYVMPGPGVNGLVPSEQIMLQQLNGPYFGLPKVTRFTRQNITKGYDGSFVSFLAATFHKNGLPTATLSTGAMQPYFDCPAIEPFNVTVEIERVVAWRQFSSVGEPGVGLSYHLFGTNEHPLAQHRVSGIFGRLKSDWMQIFPFTFSDKNFLAEMAKYPKPATITKDSSGTWYKTSTAYLTMNIAIGNCQMRVPERKDSVFERLVHSSSEIPVWVTCEYFCTTDPANTNNPENRDLRCSNSFNDFGYDGPPNTAMLPSKTWHTTIIVGKEQALMSSMALGAANPAKSVGETFMPFVTGPEAQRTIEQESGTEVHV
jgi:hypothetical protein